MKLGPRGKLVAIMALFVVPIAASVLAYNFMDVKPTANYGELITPPAAITTQRFTRPDGSAFAFEELRGRWALVASDAGACPAACEEKLATMRQARLALGRNASRVERVFVVDDGAAPRAETLAPLAGMVVALAPPADRMRAEAANDREHIYLVDPNGNVMMRWPHAPDGRRMIKDLERLLKASQIG
jgi:cytochrome oxidase Cu insertion factor (SCO1/SenC/PrrC family)